MVARATARCTDSTAVTAAARRISLHLESRGAALSTPRGSRARRPRATIALDDYASWGDAERIAVNMAALYRELGDPSPPPNTLELFTLMAQLERDRR